MWASGGHTVSTRPPTRKPEGSCAPAQVARLASLRTGILGFPLTGAQAGPGSTISTALLFLAQAEATWGQVNQHPECPHCPPEAVKGPSPTLPLVQAAPQSSSSNEVQDDKGHTGVSAATTPQGQ